MLIQELKKLTLKSEVISLERNCHNQALTGVLTSINERTTGMQLYTEEGDYEGYTLFETVQITDVCWGNREHQALGYLIEQQDTPCPPTFSSKSFQERILELGQKYASVCFHEAGYEESFILGEIEKCDPQWLKIHAYGITHSLSRMYRMVLRQEISRVVVDSPYQHKILHLHQAEF